MNRVRFQGLSQPALIRRYPWRPRRYYRVLAAPLPIDSHLDQVRAALDERRAAVLTAAPGAGKTTRVPPSLVDRGRVLLLQPRRVAARAMARRIAEERQWTIGREVGWHIRFERKFTRDTRLLVVTEGILTAYLQDDPLISEMTTLVIDEFHERSLHADLGLAMARQAWQARSDLRILVMSATLETAPISAFLKNCPVIDVPGTLHPLSVAYAPGKTVAQAVGTIAARSVGNTSVGNAVGNILCFLPGAREIDEAVNACRSLSLDADILPLHGSLDSAAQDAALAPGSRRRVIVATNVAETSLTVPGVSAVVDSGWQKVAHYNADRGVDALTLERITADSATQRAGRAARLGPGQVIRLWDERDRLRPHREAEIDRVDLSGPLLSILSFGELPDTFEWFDRPSEDRLQAGLTLLERLGAVVNGAITPVGRLMQRLPLPPRLARVLVAAQGSAEGCAECARLSEAPGRASFQLRSVADQLAAVSRSILGRDYRPHINDADLRRALLAGYPDRVARRRQGDKFTLATGHGAVLARDSGAQGADWIIAVDVTAGRTTAMTEALIREASTIDPEWLSRTRFEVRHAFDRESGTVRATEIDWYDEVPLREHPIAPTDAERARLLAAAWRERGPDEASERLIRRMAFAGAGLDLDEAITSAASLARKIDDLVLTEDALSWETRNTLARLAPESLAVPSGRSMRIDYLADGSVAVSVKLQELFGLAETPLVGPKRTPITFSLLAPNGRPVQTTRDLKSFWERTYPEVRKELRGRYPRHPWPDDPWNATPTHRTKKSTPRV